MDPAVAPCRIFGRHPYDEPAGTPGTGERLRDRCRSDRFRSPDDQSATAVLCSRHFWENGIPMTTRRTSYVDVFTTKALLGIPVAVVVA
jgi:hypothetical protein